MIDKFKGKRIHIKELFLKKIFFAEVWKKYNRELNLNNNSRRVEKRNR